MRNLFTGEINPFNEKIYTGNNKAKERAMARIFQNDQMLFQKDRAYEKEENKEVIALYKEYLNELKKLILSLNICRTDLEKALVVEYLLQKGFLSNNIENDNNKLQFNLGVNVLENTKSSREISRFYFDLFKYSTDYPLEYPCYSSNRSNSLRSHSAMPNHIIDLAEHNGTLFGIDLTTKRFYTFNSGMEMEELSSQPNLYLRYKPYFEILTKDHSICDIKTYIDLFKSNAITDALLPEEASALRKKIYEMLDLEQGIIEKFNKDTKPIKEEVHEKLLSKKR